MKAHVIFFVDDQARSTVFYRELLGIPPCLEVPGMTEFPLSETTVLGLMPRSGAQRLLGSVVAGASLQDGLSGELYLVVEDPQTFQERALALGCRLLSPLQVRNWGHRVCYVISPDGHLLAFAGSC
jgi:catechol 2,3-dioxygenase-like lactoylglutathione lyase family enzyme